MTKGSMGREGLSPKVNGMRSLGRYGVFLNRVCYKSREESKQGVMLGVTKQSETPALGERGRARRPDPARQMNSTLQKPPTWILLGLDFLKQTERDLSFLGLVVLSF